MEVTKESVLPIATASQNLASYGVTGINDMTPANDLNTCRWFAALQSSGDLVQNVRLSGTRELSAADGSDRRLSIGETKVHLHESDLPDFYDLCRIISTSHDDNRAVAIHCVTEVELVFALASLAEAGTRSGDRLEHASVIPPGVLTLIGESGLSVVTQPNFVLERGDAYRVDIPEQEHAWLYRCQTLIQHAIPLAFGTDLPFGHPDPWVAIRAATMRETASGKTLGVEERVTPEVALRCFLGELESPTTIRSVAIGEPADFCLLDSPWSTVRLDLTSNRVKTTFRDGQVIYQR
jgi:predicted amidohydrolase YtcJ